MLPRFHWSDITTVGHYLGVLILLTGAAMLVPTIVALIFGEVYQFCAFFVGVGICAAAGAALCFLKSRGLDRRRSLLLVGFGWIVIGIIAAVPLYLSDSYASMLDALFDSVSALTSTGVTLAANVDAMSRSQATWHVVMSFLGAITVVAIALYIGFFGEGSRVHVRTDRREDKRALPRFSETWLLVGRVFVVFAAVGTIVAFVVCLTLGMGLVDAIMNGFWLALCATGTSGFVPHGSDLIYYHSPVLQMVLSVLMIAGALSFGIYSLIRRQEFKRILRNSELRVYVIWIVLLVVFVVSIMTGDNIITTLGGFIQNALMPIISAVTTCGMQTVYPEQIGHVLSEGAAIWIIVAILFGACAYSTGGGIKIVRILQVLHWIKYSILLRLAPDNAIVRVKYEQFGSRDLSARDATLAMTVSIMFLAAAALGSMAFIAYGNDALDSVFEVVSYLSNCGMTTSITQEGLPPGLKIVALLLMWAGRAEFIALIAAIVGIIHSLYPANLFSNMRSRDLRSHKNTNRGGTAWRNRTGKKPSGAASIALACVLATALISMGSVIPLASASPDSGGVEVPAEEVETLTNPEPYHAEEIHSLLCATVRQDLRGVAIEGEAIGAALIADPEHKWVNVKGNGSMIGVYMTNEQADAISHYGAYEHRGDTLLIKGEFHLACPEHQGELEVHADSVELLSAGYSWTRMGNAAFIAWGFTLLALGIILMLIRQHMRKGRL